MPGSFKCHVCGAAFDSEQELTYHVGRHQQVEEAGFRSRLCGATFSREEELQVHEKTHAPQ
jgi:hypothetical protein